MVDVVRTNALRPQLAGELLALFPSLKRRFQAGIPQQLRDQLASVTSHQLEALGLLMQLRGHEGGASMQEVARIQGCALSTATALADRLIRQGLADRVSDVDDRRVVKIVPTARAVAMLETFAESRLEIALSVLSPLSDDEAVTLIDLLQKLALHEPDAKEGTHG